MYVAAKGGERAIENAHRLLAYERRGDPSVPELSLAQIGEQLTLAVDRVMNEGSLYDRELAALAIKQARGDLIEAIFLVRAFRATLPRLAPANPSTRQPCQCGGVSLRLSKISRAANSSARPSTTPIVCWSQNPRSHSQASRREPRQTKIRCRG